MHWYRTLWIRWGAWLWNHLEEALCALLLMAMALLAFANVLVRYLTDYSFAFTEELEVAGLVYLTLLGAALAFRRRQHLGLTFLWKRLPSRFQKMFILLETAVILGVFGILSYYALFQIRDEMELHTLSEALEIPEWIYTLGLPVGSVLIMMRTLETAVKTWCHRVPAQRQPDSTLEGTDP